MNQDICDENELQWLQENANQLVYYQDKIGVCNVICFCQCSKHQSIAVLFVKPRQKQSATYQHPMFVLPGGKRDLKAYQQSEPCWEAVSREFQEEVDDNLNYFCKKKCRFFEETVQVNLDTNMILDPKVKLKLQQGFNRNINLNDNAQQSNLSTSKQKNVESSSILSTDEQLVQNSGFVIDDPKRSIVDPSSMLLDKQQLINGNVSTKQNNETQTKQTQEKERFITISRRIRSYFIEINCQDLPDIQFGRFHLFEVTERKWFDLEFIIDQFKGQYQIDRTQMIISPKIFKSMSIFGGKLVNIQQKQLQKLKFIYQPDICNIDINKDSDVQDDLQDQPQDCMNLFIQKQIEKINKTHSLFTRINFSIKQQPLIQQIGSSVAFI